MRPSRPVAVAGLNFGGRVWAEEEKVLMSKRLYMIGGLSSPQGGMMMDDGRGWL